MAALAKGINFRYINETTIGLSISEATLSADIIDIVNIINKSLGQSEITHSIVNSVSNLKSSFSNNFARTSEYLTHDVFNSYHTEN